MAPKTNMPEGTPDDFEGAIIRQIRREERHKALDDAIAGVKLARLVIILAIAGSVIGILAIKAIANTAAIVANLPTGGF